MAERSPRDVLADHLRNRREGRLREDLEQNYTDDVIVLSHLGHFQGKDAVRTLAALLDQQLRDALFFYESVLIDGDFAFLQWSAQGRELRVSNGADSYLFRDGLICKQSIYYSIETNPGASDTAGAV